MLLVGLGEVDGLALDKTALTFGERGANGAGNCGKHGPKNVADEKGGRKAAALRPGFQGMVQIRDEKSKPKPGGAPNA